MPVVVQKYGGSSVADVGKLAAVADRVVATKQRGCDVVVVVSAMGKTTDGLLSLAQQVASSHQDADVPAPRRELDMLVSTGERVTMALMSIAIQARGLDAISFTGSQSGIITNDRHFDARIIEVRPHRIEDELARGRVVIVAGYQGMSYKREITTLGRGGTDTTAVALAAALRAERCEIYSDVDGVYSADPRSVPDAKHLPELDYEMLQEMAESGAKVLCAQAVEWARKSGVAIFARSTFDVAEPARETIVRRDAPTGTVRARAVTAAANAALVRGNDLAGATSLSPMFVHRSDTTTLVLVRDNVPDWAAVKDQLTAAGATVEDDVAVVSVVGSALTDRFEAIGLFEAALGDIAITVLDATALRISAVIARSDLQQAQQRLHAAFIDGDQPPA